MRTLHPYSRGTLAAICIIGVVFACAAILFLPDADSESMRDALGVMAQILGVLLGAVLIVIGRFIEQRSGAELLLERWFQAYRELIEDKSHLLLEAWKGVAQEVQGGETDLDRPSFVGSALTYRQVLHKLATLVHAIGGREQREPVVHKLRFDFGHSNSSITHIRKAGYRAKQEPEYFFRLLYDVFRDPAVDTYVTELALEGLDKLRSDGITQALKQLTRSRKVLRSKTLALCVSVLAGTITAAVLAILGIADNTASNLTVAVTLLTVKGFVLSMILTLLLIEKMVLYAL